MTRTRSANKPLGVAMPLCHSRHEKDWSTSSLTESFEDIKLRKTLRHNAHDAFGQLGANKMLRRLSASSFFLMGMWKVMEKYALCNKCQKNKSCMSLKAGDLHSLPALPRPSWTRTSHSRLLVRYRSRTGWTRCSQSPTP